MGNSALTCFRRGGPVKVVLLNGDIVEFKQPVRASVVMRKYPNHVVLHCSTEGSHAMGQRRKISVMKPEQALKAKQNYLIMPIQAAAGNSPSFVDSWAFFALNASKQKKRSRVNHTNNSKRSSRPKSWFQKFFAKIFKSAQVQGGSEEESTQPLLGSDRSSRQSRSTADGVRDWRPSLDRIPESPSHSPDFHYSYSKSRRVELR